jgi:hypothetical protein
LADWLISAPLRLDHLGKRFLSDRIGLTKTAGTVQGVVGVRIIHGRLASAIHRVV